MPAYDYSGWGFILTLILNLIYFRVAQKIIVVKVNEVYNWFD
jgi:hypothetical protein